MILDFNNLENSCNNISDSGRNNRGRSKTGDSCSAGGSGDCGSITGGGTAGGSGGGLFEAALIN